MYEFRGIPHYRVNSVFRNGLRHSVQIFAQTMHMTLEMQAHFIFKEFGKMLYYSEIKFQLMLDVFVVAFNLIQN